MSTEKSRRAFLKVVPAAVAGAVAAKTFAQQAPAGPISAQTVGCAESIAGLDFHAAEQEAIARSLNANLTTYQQLRQLEIPHDTEVALTFRPYMPGDKPKGPATPGKALRYSKPALGTVTRPTNIEDVAFWPVTKLAGSSSASSSPLPS